MGASAVAASFQLAETLRGNALDTVDNGTDSGLVHWSATGQPFSLSPLSSGATRAGRVSTMDHRRSEHTLVFPQIDGENGTSKIAIT